MKNISLAILLLAGATSAPAANLMINFHTDDTGPVSGEANLTLSPGHATGMISGSETTWNNLNSTNATSSLLYSDGSAATGVSLTIGSESLSLVNTIDYSTTGTINVTAVDGTGGATPGNIGLMSSPDSIYGDGTGSSNTAPARAGWLGNANDTNDGLGLRIDGLAAGEYTILVLGRNTNSNATRATDFFAGAGSSAGTFDYSALTAFTAANPAVPTSDPTGHDAFVAGENYMSIDVALADGDSLFLAADGNPDGDELRGFLNMVQIVPEPSTALLSLAGALLLCRRRR